MPRRRGPADLSGRAKRERDLETVRLVNDALQQEPVRRRARVTPPPRLTLSEQVDVTTLRKLAAVRGLVTDPLRARVWPRLLNADVPRAAPAQRAESHRDSSTVQCDVERSLWHFTADWSDERRALKRAALQRILNGAASSGLARTRGRSRTRSAGVVCSHADTVHYYQGLHDVASVLLLVCGEAAAYALLERLALGHLRDCTRATLDPVMQLLRLLFPLLAQCDPELHAFLQRSGVLPYFALTWVLTWHVHEARNLQVAARLFDLFMSSSPLMPLYVGAVALLAERDAILAQPCDAAELHRFLSAVNVLGRLSADELAARALALHRDHPPARLQQLAGLRLPKDCALNSYPFTGAVRGMPPHKRSRMVRIAGAVGTSVAAITAAAVLGGPLSLYAARALLAATSAA